MKIAILGATSALAHEAAKHFAAEGARFVLVARNADKLAAIASDLTVRGAEKVNTLTFDLGDLALHREIVTACGEVDVVLIAHGSYPEQRAIDRDPAAQLATFELNATSVISLGAHFANLLEAQRRGTLAVIGSVAGDRGRRTNYVYGSAKAAVHAYFEGLRNRLAAAGAHVLVIKPGSVDTPMTRNVRKTPLFASATTVGRGIHDAIVARRSTVYLPWYWRWISLVLRALPWKFVRF